MHHNTSPIPDNLVVEFIGPLVDDGGSLGRTVEHTLVDLGVEIRPGAMEQVMGANLEWMFATLLEGHGRVDLLERQEELTARIIKRWRDTLRGGMTRAAAGATDAWSVLSSGERRLAVLSTLPNDLTLEVADRVGLGDLSTVLLDGSGENGPPRPDLLQALAGAWMVQPSELGAAVSSAPAMLAAISARCGHVTLVGAPSAQAALLAEHAVGSLGEMLDQA